MNKSSPNSTYKKVFWASGFGWMFDAMDVGLTILYYRIFSK